MPSVSSSIAMAAIAMTVSGCSGLVGPDRSSSYDATSTALDARTAHDDDAASDAGSLRSDATTTVSVDAAALDSAIADREAPDADLLGADANDGGADAGTSDASVVAEACRHFFPGHYYRQVDSAARNIDGLGNTTFDLTGTRLDLSRFAGILVQIDWAMLESQRGVYDFSRIDQFLALVKSKGLHLRLKIMDRTFWQGCNPPTPYLPSYVQSVPGTVPNLCFADIWSSSTMDGYIALHIAIARRYEAEAAFVGFNTEETAMGVDDVFNRSRAMYAERVRLTQELFAAVPGAIFISEFNWPLNGDLTQFSAMIDASRVGPADAPLNAMGVSWPDSWLNVSAYPPSERNQAISSIQCTESVASDGKRPCPWYGLARTYQNTTVVAPNIEAGVITGTATEAEALYQMVDTDLGAQMVTWDSWTGVNGDYLRQVVIPLVNRHQGRLRNMACPFGGH